MNGQRAREKMRSHWTRMRQNRSAYAASYDAWTVSSVKRIGFGISTGIVQMWTGSFMSSRIAMTSR